MREFTEQDCDNLVSLMADAYIPPYRRVWHIEVISTHYHISYSADSEEEAEEIAAQQLPRQQVFPHATIMIRPPGQRCIEWKPNKEWKSNT